MYLLYMNIVEDTLKFMMHHLLTQNIILQRTIDSNKKHRILEKRKGRKGEVIRSCGNLLSLMNSFPSWFGLV